MEAILEYEDVLSVLSGKMVDKIKRPVYKAFARECVAISSEQYAILACLIRQNMSIIARRAYISVETFEYRIHTS